MNIEPEHSISASTNLPEVPAGWAKMYTREGLVRLVPEGEMDNALREGLLPKPFDLDGALAEFNAAMEDGRVSVPKALAESIATGFVRDEDSWIINDCMAKVRDAFANLIFTAGALLPTEADIHALKEYAANESKREELRAQVAALTEAGQPVPEGMEKNANGSKYYDDRLNKHAKAMTNISDEAHSARLARAEEDRNTREANKAEALAMRVRALQIAYADSDGKSGAPVELENGVMKRRDLQTGMLYVADPNTGEFLPEPEETKETPVTAPETEQTEEPA